MSFSFALSESRRLFLRSPSVRSLASAVSEPRQFFVACEDCTARFALSLLWRLDNRVSSSSALSEARRIFLVSSAGCCNFMRVLSLNWNYGMCSARYWRAGASQPSRTSGSDFSIYIYIYIIIYIYIYMYMGIYTRRMHGIVGERERSNCVVATRCI